MHIVQGMDQDTLELIERRPTGRTFHRYFNPGREFEPGAQEVTGLTLEFLADKQPSLKGKNPADFVDARFVRKLEEEGFFKKFSKK